MGRAFGISHCLSLSEHVLRGAHMLLLWQLKLLPTRPRSHLSQLWTMIISCICLSGIESCTFYLVVLINIELVRGVAKFKLVVLSRTELLLVSGSFNRVSQILTLISDIFYEKAVCFAARVKRRHGHVFTVSER